MLTKDPTGQGAELPLTRAASTSDAGVRTGVTTGVTESARQQEPAGPPGRVSYLQNRRRLMFVIEALTVGGAEQMVLDLANEFARREERR